MKRMIKVKKICFCLMVWTFSLFAASTGLTEGVMAGPKALLLDATARAKIIQSRIIDRLERGEKTVDVIILLQGYKDYVGKIKADNPEEMKTKQTEVRNKQDLILNRLSSGHFTLKHRFDNIQGFAGSISREGIEALAAMPEVESIEEDRKVEAQDIQGINIMNGSRLPPSYDGSGVSIAIVDTGIDYMHQMLGGTTFPNLKVIGGYDFGDNDTDPRDCNGHGTRVAGIAAGSSASGPGDYIGGVANNARLYALKIVAGCAIESSDSTIIAAWDWAITHKNANASNPIMIINTSFGGGRFYSACDADQPAYAAMANNAAANGITIFSAAGNEGYADSIGSPACVTNSLSVGAVYDANIGLRFWVPCVQWATADNVACYSNSANFLDILAPSNDAYTTDIGGAYYHDFGGTSAATAYASGTGALLQSYAKATTGQFFSSANLRTRLTMTGDPITDTYKQNGITKPRVNILTAFGASLFDLSCSHLPVRIAGTTPIYYNTIQAAYNDANSGATIQSLYGTYQENLDINRDVSITLSGGYDCDFPSKRLGNSTVFGSITTTAGELTIGNFFIK